MMQKHANETRGGFRWLYNESLLRKTMRGVMAGAGQCAAVAELGNRGVGSEVRRGNLRFPGEGRVAAVLDVGTRKLCCLVARIAPAPPWCRR